MNNDQFESLLGKLKGLTTEPVCPELKENIKKQIPSQLNPHKGLGNINIIIDLRVGKLAAAAIIVITTISLASFFRAEQPYSDGIYADSKIFIKHIIAGPNFSTSEMQRSLEQFRDYLLSQNKKVVYYGNKANLHDQNAVLMQWKIGPDRYRVILGNMQTREVDSEELVLMLSKMLKGKDL